MNEQVERLFLVEDGLQRTRHSREITEVDGMCFELRVGVGDFGKIISDPVDAITLAHQTLNKAESERCLGSGDNCNVHKL